MALTFRSSNYINVVMIWNSKLMKNRQHRLNTNRQKTSFPIMREIRFRSSFNKSFRRL